MTDVTNRRIGDLIGLSHSAVSRIRSGSRLPSIETMVEIEKVLRWKIADQVKSREAGKYAEDFEARLKRNRTKLPAA